MTTQVSFYRGPVFVGFIGARPGLDSEFRNAELLKNDDAENHGFVKILKMLRRITCESKNFKRHYGMSMVRPRRALECSNMMFGIIIFQYNS